MPGISAAMVVKLRKISGQGMMDCKIALQESGGDIDKAIDILRKKGLATLSKRAARETTEGVIVSKSTEDEKIVAMATLCCETDFVANSDDFLAAAEALANYALQCPADEGPKNILNTVIDSRKFSDILAETASKTGEKIQVGDFAKYKLTAAGLISTYIHFNKKVATMLHIKTDTQATASSKSMKQVATDIAMHITAAKPLAISKEGIAQDIIDREKSIYAEQVKDKPENIVAKIIEGKMKKFFAENCLLEQAFVKDDSKTVSQIFNQAAKSANGQAEIIRFARFEIG